MLAALQRAAGAGRAVRHQALCASAGLQGCGAWWCAMFWLAGLQRAETCQLGAGLPSLVMVFSRAVGW